MTQKPFFVARKTHDLPLEQKHDISLMLIYLFFTFASPGAFLFLMVTTLPLGYHDKEKQL